MARFLNPVQGRLPGDSLRLCKGQPVVKRKRGTTEGNEAQRRVIVAAWRTHLSILGSSAIMWKRGSCCVWWGPLLPVGLVYGAGLGLLMCPTDWGTFLAGKHSSQQKTMRNTNEQFSKVKSWPNRDFSQIWGEWFSGAHVALTRSCVNFSELPEEGRGNGRQIVQDPNYIVRHRLQINLLPACLISETRSTSLPGHPPQI